MDIDDYNKYYDYQLSNRFIDDCIDSEYNRIMRMYPIGMKGYMVKYPNITKEDIIRKENEIINLEIFLNRFYKIRDKYPIGLATFINICEEKNINLTFKIVFNSIDKIVKLEKIGKDFKTFKKLENCVKDWNKISNILFHKYLVVYYPISCRKTLNEKEIKDRDLVWNFKCDSNGKFIMSYISALNNIIPQIIIILNDTFNESLQLLTLVCIPASTSQSNNIRFGTFSRCLCRKTNMENAYEHIVITKDATPKHLGGTGFPELSFDKDYFKGRYILLFDDVVTTGNSMLKMKQKLESLGATVIAAISIGKTVYEKEQDSRYITIDNEYLYLHGKNRRTLKEEIQKIRTRDFTIHPQFKTMYIGGKTFFLSQNLENRSAKEISELARHIVVYDIVDNENNINSYLLLEEKAINTTSPKPKVSINTNPLKVGYSYVNKDIPASDTRCQVKETTSGSIFKTIMFYICVILFVLINLAMCGSPICKIPNNDDYWENTRMHTD